MPVVDVYSPAGEQALAAEVPAAAELFKKASAILGYDLLQVCSEGPKEKLDSTVVSTKTARPHIKARSPQSH